MRLENLLVSTQHNPSIFQRTARQKNIDDNESYECVNVEKKLWAYLLCDIENRKFCMHIIRFLISYNTQFTRKLSFIPWSTVCFVYNVFDEQKILNERFICVFALAPHINKLSEYEMQTIFSFYVVLLDKFDKMQPQAFRIIAVRAKSLFNIVFLICFEI